MLLEWGYDKRVGTGGMNTEQALAASSTYAAEGGLPGQIAALQEDVARLQQQVRRLMDHARVQDAVIAHLQTRFVRGRGDATFGRLALEGGPPAGGDTPMTTILSLAGFGDVLMFCSTDATPTTSGGFAFLNTTSDPVLVAGFGTLQPEEKINQGAISNGSNSSTFQVTADFDHPDRIATVTVGGIVEGNTCLGHAHAIAQP